MTPPGEHDEQQPVRPIAYVDIETTSLNPFTGEVIEIGWAIDNGPINSLVVPHTGLWAEREALDINGYHERCMADPTTWCTTMDLLHLQVALTDCTIAAANAQFDIRFLERLFKGTPWHHRQLDVESYAAGALGWSSPRGLAETVAELSSRTGATPPSVDEHTAEGDVALARWVHLTAAATPSHRERGINHEG